MAHTSKVRWADIEGVVEFHCGEMLRISSLSEQAYLDLLELWGFAGATDQAVADLLFKEEWQARGDTQASADEVAKVVDLKDAMIALHEVYQALNNQAVTTADRVAKLRRMS